jgi:hypothetical protein
MLYRFILKPVYCHRNDSSTVVVVVVTAAVVDVVVVREKCFSWDCKNGVFHTESKTNDETVFVVQQNFGERKILQL